jgi:para-aminobenzoate synthetase component 1
LAARSAAPFSAFWHGRGHALASNSPERLVRLTPKDGALHAEARPIKGTRPRGANPAEDTALARELTESLKDRAENLMIVDLLRNDLSRICDAGTVRAPVLFGLESFANVHHLVSVVTGRLRARADPFDLLAALFPGGSVTGAPKIRAAEIIGELEEEARGAYCGSLAWIGPDGAMDSSILIRTATFDATPAGWPTGWNVSLRAGGGIVADSDPAAEVQESFDKAAAILSAFKQHSAGAAA